MQNPVLKNVENGQIIELIKSPFSIGRALTCDYVIENKIVSRTHCRLTKTDEGWTLTDSSTNGTLVNDGHYKGETSPVLKHNDEISLGYESYTYRFITGVEKVPNCQVERLKSQETSVKRSTSAFNEQPSPNTPNSFDENGISDEMLNNVADNILDIVSQQSSNAESHSPANYLLKNSEKPSTSKRPVDSQQGPESSEAPFIPLGCGHLSSKLLSAGENNLEEAVSTSNTNYISGQLNNKNGEPVEQNTDLDEKPQSQSNSSVSTVIYSLPDEISEVPHPVIDNRTEQASNTIVEKNKNTDIPQVNIATKIATTSVPNIPAKPRDLLAESIEAVVRRFSDVTPSFTRAQTSTPVQSTGPVSSTFNAIPSSSTTFKMFTSVSNPIPSSNTTLLTPTSVSLASPMNANKKVKVMTVSSGVISHLRPALGQTLTTYTVGTGPQAPIVRRVSQNEMQRILANQPRMPVVILDRFPVRASVPGTTRINNISVQTTSGGSGTRNSQGAPTSVTSSAHVGTAILEGIRRSINIASLPLSTRNQLEGAVRNFGQGNPEVPNTTAGHGTFISGNALLQASKDHNSGCTKIVSGNILQPAAEHLSASAGSNILRDTLLQMAEVQIGTCVPGNTLPQTVEHQNTTAGSTLLVSSNTLPQVVEDQAVTAEYAGGVIGYNNSTAVDAMSVPAAVHEVVIDNTVNTMDDVNISAAGTSINRNVPAIICHDSQEPGSSNAQANDNNKKKNQNQYEEMENELMCTICANLFIKPVTLGCSHSFCQYCIGQWKKKKTDCPICRNQITSTTRTLVLDNIIEKMVETASEEDKQDRKAALEERKNIEDAEAAKKNQKNANKNNGRGTARGRRGRGNSNTRGNQSNNAGNQPASNPNPTPVITIADSPSTTDSDNSSDSTNNSDEYDYDNYYSDEWYNGRPGVYYGGYGRCYNCGERGHWSNGCPYR